MRAGLAAAAAALLVLPGCSDDPPDPIEYLSVLASPADPDDPMPRYESTEVAADSIRYLGGDDRAQVWLGRDGDTVCLLSEIPAGDMASSACALPGEIDLRTNALSVATASEIDDGWVEVYVVPDGTPVLDVPGLDRLSPNLYIGDTRDVPELIIKRGDVTIGLFGPAS